MGIILTFSRPNGNGIIIVKKSNKSYPNKSAEFVMTTLWLV